MATEEEPKIPLPKAWTGHVRSAVLHVIGLAQFATAYTRSWAANSPNELMRLKAENDRLEAEVALLEEESGVLQVSWTAQPLIFWWPV